MNRQSWTLLIAVLALLGSSAGLLGLVKQRQRLGAPGLKVVAKPIHDEQGQVVGNASVELPEHVLGYVSTNRPMRQVELAVLPRDTTFGRRGYDVRTELPENDARRFLDLSVVLMGSDRTSIHKPQFCLTGQGWNIEQAEALTILMERPHRYDLPVMKLTARQEVRDGHQVATYKAVYVYWFVAEDRLTAEHSSRMWSMVTDLVTTGVMPRWAYVSCFAICLPGEEQETYERMVKLIVAAVPEFQLTTRPAQTAAAAPSRAFNL